MSILDILFTVLIQPLSLAFEVIYVIANDIICDPGLSIIALSLTMNILVLPLYMRADKMQEKERDIEAKLRDGVAHIRKTFSGDEKAMMLQTYYRQNNYRPTDVFKGSISLMLEIPFFIAAYMFLSHLQILQGVSFWIIPDLGAPDGLIRIGDFSINALPFVMTALNLISCLLFTKGMPLKTKIQLYGMALFFLVFLYGSPSGLVFYWTLNNLFALVKTIFYKIKHPKPVLMALSTIVGAAFIAFGVLTFGTRELTYNVIIFVIGGLCILPVVAFAFIKAFKFSFKPPNHEPNKWAFLSGALFLTVLLGAVIPSAVIVASPQEFVSIYHFSHPMWFIAKSLCLAIGAFMIWANVFYWLCNKRVKLIFETGIWAICVIAIVNYLFFGTDLGMINAALQYENGMNFGNFATLLNANVIVIIILIIVFLGRFARKFVPRLMAVGAVALAIMAGMNVATINESMDRVTASMGNIKLNDKGEAEAPSFELSKDGKNVVVLMLDRGLNYLVPYLFNERPDLKQQFDGFTYYDNVTSLAASTNTGLPAVMGGYEYSPEEMDKRADESLASKHNEALKVMPVLFNNADYNVTVCDPSYAGYQNIPDLSIYNDYPDIDAYIAKAYYTDTWPKTRDADMRNFFCYAFTKASPLFIQPLLYDSGEYNTSIARTSENSPSGQVVSDNFMTADGIYPSFLDTYTVLEHLNDMTKITDGNSNNFLLMTNETAHDVTLLQEPQYEPATHVDNTDFEAKNKQRYTVNGVTLRMRDSGHAEHYQCNMAAYLKIGAWLEYLKANGVYDNTRIIIVADHGFPLNQLPNKLLDNGEDNRYDTEWYNPVLMVKDFNSHGFNTSHEFMTNADTPSIATNGVLENPVNPFTGKAINNIENKAHPQHIYSTHHWTVDTNNGNTFTPDGVWFSVKDNVNDLDNWKVINDPNTGRPSPHDGD